MDDRAPDEVAESDVGDVPDAEALVLHDLHVVRGAGVVPVGPEGTPKVGPGLACPEEHRGQHAAVLKFGQWNTIQVQGRTKPR